MLRGSREGGFTEYDYYLESLYGLGLSLYE